MEKNVNSHNNSSTNTQPDLSPHGIFISGIKIYEENFSLLKNSKKNEIELFLFKMLDAAPDQLQTKISQEISTLDYAPLKIVRYLALKNITVAKPILTHSTVLTERDLLIITNLRGNEHRAAIATRKDITFPISYKLVEMGNDEVIRILTANANALISQKTFKLIGDKVTLKAELEEIIKSRNDISAKSLEYLLEKFDSSELLNISENSNDRLKSIIKIKMDKSNGDKTRKSSDHSKSDKKLESLYELKTTYESKRVTEQTLISAIESDESDVVICVFSILSELHLEETLDVISSADARKLAIASKAKNLKIDTVKTFLNSKIWDTTLPKEKISDAVRTFKGLKQNIACDLLNKQQAHI